MASGGMYWASRHSLLPGVRPLSTLGSAPASGSMGSKASAAGPTTPPVAAVTDDGSIPAGAIDAIIAAEGVAGCPAGRGPRPITLSMYRFIARQAWIGS